MRYLLLVMVSWLMFSCTNEELIRVTPREVTQIEGPLYLAEVDMSKDSGGKDPWATIEERLSGDSGNTYNSKSGEENDDPWNTIRDKFDVDSAHTGKSKNGKPSGGELLFGGYWIAYYELGDAGYHKSGGGKDNHDDPWTTIRENFDVDSVYTGKSKKGKGKNAEGERDAGIADGSRPSSVDGGSELVFENADQDNEYDDPWNTIADEYGARALRSSHPVQAATHPIETASDESTGEHSEIEAGLKGQAVFILMASQLDHADGTGIVSEIRGDVALVSMKSGAYVFVVYCPRSWGVGQRVSFVK